MTNRPLHDPEIEERRFQPTEGPAPASHSIYADLCALENLQPAYAHLKEIGGKHGIDPLAFETIEAEGVEPFLQQLSSDLQTRTYQPAQVAEDEGRVTLRDLVVQIALKRLLETAFPPAFPSDPEPEKTIKWLAGNIDKGLSRIYAVNLNENLDAGGYKRLVERVSRRIADPQLIDLLKQILVAPAMQGNLPQGLLAPLLADIACEGIDHILQQAKTLGREDNFLHVQCTRVTNELIVLSDRDPRYGWIVPAVQHRLHEELSALYYDLEVIETQFFDMTCGEPLRFLDFELRCAQKRSGELQVRYRLVAESSRRQADKAPARQRRLGRYHPLRFVQPCLNWLERWRFVHGVYRKANAIQVGWRHLPITLLPVLMIIFGWLSLVPLLCLAAIPVCNWRWILSFVQGVFQGVYGKVNAIQVGWRHLPITLIPILTFLFGWRSPVTWLCLALIFVCNWRWTLGFMRSGGTWSGRHKLDVVMGTCALVALVCLSPLLRDIYANRPREVAIAAPLPPGFYLGEHHGASWWNGESTPAVNYGLYVPPNLQGQKGPLPLIVFLHGYGERTKTSIFRGGLPQSIARRFGTNKPNGHFQFVAFFPIDPTGRWQVGSAEVENTMMALDYVIGRHRIDPARVYLTGHSAGGSGVWALAEAYPHKWAAVAPLCSFTSPDVDKVRHLPAWIFHGAKDQQAPVERDRLLVRQLQAAGADVRYTEIPNKGHYIWEESYNPKEFYKWLASKKKD